MIELPILTHEYIMRGTGKLQNLEDPLGDDIIRHLKSSNATSLEEGETGRKISDRELLENIVSVAEWLRSKGIKEHDVIAICSENRLEFAVPVAATLCIGACANTLNPLYTSDELKHVLTISKPRLVFCSPFTTPKMQEMKKMLPFIEDLIIFDAGYEIDEFTSYTALVNKKYNVDSFKCANIDGKETVAAILCSSGTTGLPKCVDLTHKNFRCFMGLIQVSNFLTPDDVILGLVPFFHGYGLGLLLASLVLEGKVVILSKFDEETFLSTIQNHRISRLHIVPPLAIFLAKHPLVDKYDLSSVKKIICGAAPLSKETETAVKKRLKSVEAVQQAYGMTELSVASTLPPTLKYKVGSVGVIGPQMECKVVDPDTGKSLPPFQEGELCFRGDILMKGYRNNPEATAATIDSAGWLHSGDIGYYDEEGFIFIVDRLKELIKFKGFQVAPAELEALLLTNPKIKDAGVVGLPNEEAGELPIAFVTLQPGATATEDEIKKFIAAKVSPQKRLHVVKFVEAVPKNPSGKILRRELRKMVAQAKL